MGRYVTGLAHFDDLNILLKYLYLSEENTVEYTNTMNTVFSLHMNDDFSMEREIIDSPFKETIGMKFDCHDTEIGQLMAIVEQLKETPVKGEFGLKKEMSEHFNNRFEELKEITLMQLALNDSNQRKINREGWEK